MTQETLTGSVRAVVRTVRGLPTSDGAGVRLTRVIGQAALPDLDPFLLLDEFRSDDANDYIAGFPEHPHRGFETVTYMLAGRMRHGDNAGNSGLLIPGSVQWMTAGRGIVHSEMPEQEDGLMWGFQLWVNLPASDKMTAPRYQDIAPERIPEIAFDGGRLRVIAGRFRDVDGPVQAVRTEPSYFDVRLDAGRSFSTDLPVAHNAFIYVYEGNALVGSDARPQPLAQNELGVLGRGDAVAVRAGSSGARFIVLAGQPLGEPVARYGPIVMNTRDELQQAFTDLREGNF